MARPDRGPSAPDDVALDAPHRPEHASVLTTDALSFVADLARAHTGAVEALLAARAERQARCDAGEPPGFLTETEEVRRGDWRIGPVPDDLRDRRVEITGPTDRKMAINALNSGANMFMADFEDALSPTWDNLVSGQRNLCEAVAGTIRHEQPESGKVYELALHPAVLLVRPRGWHLWERHMEVAGKAVPGALLDFGLYLYHNARRLLEKGTGPYFYLPKLEDHREARLWNEVFVDAQERLGLPRGTIKATVLIETLPAVFQMDEILYELRDHIAGLNCGRWDYIFSYIKTFNADPGHVLPDRGQVTMEQPFMRAYTQLLIKTCHRRGAHAMGGMAAQIPIKDDPEANEAALEKVRADKEREVRDGHDGTWVAHPGLIPVAKEVFDRHMPGPNQLDVRREDVEVGERELLEVPAGTRTLEGLRNNVRVGVQYLEAWLRGVGSVPLYHLMEDAATAEIARSQIWQWIRHGTTLASGEPATPGLLARMIDEEMERVRGEVGGARFEHGRFAEARELFERVATAPEMEPFMTLPAYGRLLELERGQG